MRAYRHLFHAGNFADVFKHALLAQLMLLMVRKPAPFLCLDTHAGLGRYELTHAWALKNSEFEQGIARLWPGVAMPAALAALLQPYLDAVHAQNADGKLQRYPGSPLLMRGLMREQDRLVLAEYIEDDCAALAALFKNDRRTQVHCADGYQLLKALLPPPERRALILIDSSFDRAREFDRLLAALILAHRKFSTGVYALWYPLMGAAAMRAFEREVIATGIAKILQLDLSLPPEQGAGPMRGCGLLVVNPPFGFEPRAREMAAGLVVLLARGKGATQRIRWLTAE